MEESLVPSLSSGVVGSRFVSSDEIESAKARRDEQWKAAYARLGQEPPPQLQTDDTYDGRSLAEKLAANKIAKQEAWEEKNKLANQFRALEEDEIMFLDSIRERQEEEERQRKEKDGEDVKNFREAVAARTNALNNPDPSTSVASIAAPPKAKAPAAKKDVKKSLKGVVVKKKPKAAPTEDSKPSAKEKSKVDDTQTASSSKQPEETAPPDAKRRKIGS